MKKGIQKGIYLEVMKVLFIEYPKCSTCIKAKKTLLSLPIEFEDRHIVENTPSYDELKKWWKQSNQPLKKFFNTSGKLYKEMNLKEKLPNMSEDEQIQLLSQNGMLIKRPLLITENEVIIGFKEDNYIKVCSE